MKFKKRFFRRGKVNCPPPLSSAYGGSIGGFPGCIPRLQKQAFNGDGRHPLAPTYLLYIRPSSSNPSKSFQPLGGLYLGPRHFSFIPSCLSDKTLEIMIYRFCQCTFVSVFASFHFQFIEHFFRECCFYYE